MKMYVHVHVPVVTCMIFFAAYMFESDLPKANPIPGANCVILASCCCWWLPGGGALPGFGLSCCFLSLDVFTDFFSACLGYCNRLRRIN